jgi:hypothetical protein
MPEDRIAKLSERFRTHALGRGMRSQRNRERHSFYIDADLVSRLDSSYRDLNHGLYPGAISKSAFLETLLEYSLAHLPELKATLADLAETPDASEP